LSAVANRQKNCKGTKKKKKLYANSSMRAK
jgi:hypothetical protein